MTEDPSPDRLLERPLAFLDLETTGGTATRDRIIEVGVIEAEGGRLTGEWSTLVNPGSPIPLSIQALTGITDDMVAHAPRFDEVSGELRARLAGRVLIAHNARFDYGFLRREFQRAGSPFRSPVLCTVKLSRKLFPRHHRHNLDALMARHDIRCAARHRALADARVLWELLERWRLEVGPAAIDTAVAGLLRAPAVPPQLPADVFDDLPEAPGVYVLHGARGALYVGHGANLRSRVLAHFSGAPQRRNGARIAREVVRIDWTETAGELSALIEATRLARALEPACNRRGRRPPGADLPPWPFRGRIAVRERSLEADRSALIVLDRWCYLGTARAEHDLPELMECRPEFDPDTYRALARFFRRTHAPGTIVDLGA